MSRPRSSRPNRCSLVGFSLSSVGRPLSSRVCSRGSKGASNGAKTATKKKTEIITRPTLPRRFIDLFDLDSGIEQPVCEISKKIGDDVCDRDHQDAALDHRVIARINSFNSQTPDAGPTEDYFSDD